MKTSKKNTKIDSVLQESLRNIPIATDQVTDRVKSLLKVVKNEFSSATEIMARLELSHRPTFRKNYLNPALALGLVEMNYPESLRSPKQKYRKTKVTG